MSEQGRALVSAGSRIDRGQFLSRIAHAESFRHVGEPGWRPGPSTDEIGLALVNWMRLARTFLLGEPPPPGAALPRARRAGRAAARRVEVAPAGGSWRTLVGRSGRIPTEHIGEVRLVEVEVEVEVEFTANVALLFAYALVLGLNGAVLPRVLENTGGAVSAAEGKRRLRQMWAPLGVPVTRSTRAPSDARRTSADTGPESSPGHGPTRSSPPGSNQAPGAVGHRKQADSDREPCFRCGAGRARTHRPGFRDEVDALSSLDAEEHEDVDSDQDHDPDGPAPANVLTRFGGLAHRLATCRSRRMVSEAPVRPTTRK